MKSQSDNKRIAKNTIVLYIRTIISMVVTLYTSRVVLNVLGVENYGIYNVVGGVVAMFSVVSGALSGSISRFITFELGRNNVAKLRNIFSTSVNVQICISILIILLGETIGVWFLNTKMDIPYERLEAANWVLQCAIFSFCIGLISVPYNAMIIAHEHMSAFAYIGIFEVISRLIIVYMLYVSPWDKLETYAILGVIVSLIVRIIYGSYSKKHFEEARYCLKFDKNLFKEISSFAGWSFLTNTACLFNTQGINILINMFFGVTVNAARGIAAQVEGAVMAFINNFTTALNPQITKTYASGEYNTMNTLICRGSKFSYFLMLFFAVPVFFETEYILRLWLNVVPDYTVIFVRLGLLSALINLLGNTGYVSCMATGNIKKYTIVITVIGCLVFPISWLLFRLGFPPSASYITYALTYLAIDIAKLFLMKELFNFPIMLFIKEVIYKITLVTLSTIIVPLLLEMYMDESFIKLIVIAFASVGSTALSIYFIGLTATERVIVTAKIKELKNKFFKV